MKFIDRYAAFVARDQLDEGEAKRMRAAGFAVVLLQVDYHGSNLRQVTVDELLAEHRAADAAGLEVWWWAFLQPKDRGVAGVRPGGLAALEARLDRLTDHVPAPAGFVANCEVGGGWSPSRPNLAPFADAVRRAGIEVVGLSSHGLIGGRWPAGAFDLGLPQLYRQAVVTAPWARMCVESWSDAGATALWPTLGCSAESDAEEMRGDLAAFAELKIPAASWWCSRYLAGDKMRAAVPGENT